jgi:carbon monoxide dehydrogenase subunit G
MIESRGQVEIAKPPEDVFDYLADMRNEPKWLPGASDVRLVSEGAVGPGSKFEGTYARAGTVHCTVSEYERPNRLTIHGEAKGMSFDDTIALEATGGGTRLAAVMRTQPKGLFKLVAPMMGRVIDKQFQSNWEKLRTVLEP